MECVSTASLFIPASGLASITPHSTALERIDLSTVTLRLMVELDNPDSFDLRDQEDTIQGLISESFLCLRNLKSFWINRSTSLAVFMFAFAQDLYRLS